MLSFKTNVLLYFFSSVHAAFVNSNASCYKEAFYQALCFIALKQHSSCIAAAACSRASG